MTKTKCPECGARFAVHPDDLGHRIRCDECPAVFVAAAAPAVARPVPGGRPPAGRPAGRYDFADQPRRKPRTPETNALRIVLVVGGLFALAGVGCVAAVVVFLTGRNDPAGPGGFANVPDSLKPPGAADGPPLLAARKGFVTNLSRRGSAHQPAPNPPPAVFRKLKYPSPAGDLVAFLTPDPGDGKKHPAIVWVTGGDCNTIDEVWEPGPPGNDQTASAYRKAGVVMMFPSLRGGNDNPGVKEGFLGEIDDVLAAADFLAKQGYVDPDRVYLGGHSTGGTVAMLAAMSSARFRGVFSFGPVEDVSGYDSDFTPFNARDRGEVEVRSPGRWLHSVSSPLFVFEGMSRGNLSSLRAMQRASKNPLAHFYAVPGGDHFNILDPLNRLIAGKILADTGPTTSVAFTDAEVAAAFRNPPTVRPPAVPPPAVRPPKRTAPATRPDDPPPPVARRPSPPTTPAPAPAAEWRGSGADSVRLSNPKVERGRPGWETLTFDYDLPGGPPPGPVLVQIVLKSGGETTPRPFPLTAKAKGTMSVARPKIPPGTEVWLAASTGGGDGSERLSNVVTVP
jgi:predicted Zn finger-like uncharacterized protein